MVCFPTAVAHHNRRRVGMESTYGDRDHKSLGDKCAGGAERTSRCETQRACRSRSEQKAVF
jgi:hypothetical protein